MPRLAKNVTRRVDRLARRAHAFHQFAHHPLCEPYAAEVLRVGRRTRVCRGCAYLYGAAACGFAGGLLLRAPPAVATALLVAAVVSLWVSILRRPGRAPPNKLQSRATPGFFLGYGIGAALLGEPSVSSFALPGTTLAVLFVMARRYRKRGPDRRTCLACPEYSHVKTCRGFAPIVRRERAFMRVASRWIAAAAPRPAAPSQVHLPVLGKGA